MIGGGTSRDRRKRQTDELSAKCLGHRECARIFLDDHHPTSPGGTAACDSGILAANRRFKGGAAYIGGRFHIADGLAAGFADRQQPVVQKLGQQWRGAEFVMFKAYGAHLSCLKRSFPCHMQRQEPCQPSDNQMNKMTKNSQKTDFKFD